MLDDGTLSSGDQLVAIDGTLVQGKSHVELVNKIKGRPGTSVVLSILRSSRKSRSGGIDNSSPKPATGPDSRAEDWKGKSASPVAGGHCVVDSAVSISQIYEQRQRMQRTAPPSLQADESPERISDSNARSRCIGHNSSAPPERPPQSRLYESGGKSEGGSDDVDLGLVSVLGTFENDCAEREDGTNGNQVLSSPTLSELSHGPLVCGPEMHALDDVVAADIQEKIADFRQDKKEECEECAILKMQVKVPLFTLASSCGDVLPCVLAQA